MHKIIQIDTRHDQFEICKKLDILTEKRQSRMAFEKRDFPPESDNVETSMCAAHSDILTPQTTRDFYLEAAFSSQNRTLPLFFICPWFKG